ncbi:MAG: hypothetical protein IJP29_02850 [Lachnospiraceae bacterium]|nr:hypothetical protein [Lachnospiraceae bacterium]
MKRIIKAMEKKYLFSSLELVQNVFTEYDSAEEGKLVRQLVEEIRAKRYYIPIAECNIRLRACNEKVLDYLL